MLKSRRSRLVCVSVMVNRQCERDERSFICVACTVLVRSPDKRILSTS
jgi:hypothetical protein